MKQKQIVECNMNSMKWFGQQISKAKFCTPECPVPQNKRNWGCGCRPLDYMKECPTLKRYNKGSKDVNRCKTK